MNLEQQLEEELIIRSLEERYAKEREDLLEFIKTYFKHEAPKGIKNFLVSPFHRLIADRLHKVAKGEITRLIINIPPGHGKTELITKSFPVWRMGKNPYLRVISTGYSTTLTQEFSSEAKEYYKSEVYQAIFPRSKGVSSSQDTKEYWINNDGGSYYATGVGGTITGKRCNVFLIDDPIKPDEADESEVKRTGVNRWFMNTVHSRLFDPANDAIVIIMQRTHDDDLCGHLIERMEKGEGEDWEVLSLPAIADEDEEYEIEGGFYTRKTGEALDVERFPVDTLQILKKGITASTWSTQYQQQPTNEETQEFHEEWFKYHGTDTLPTPTNLRIFTSVDPAFKEKQHNDNTCIMTAGFDEDKMYILEYFVGKCKADVMIEKIIYHIKKRKPEKVGIEAYQAQTMIKTFLNNELEKQRLFVNIEEVKQSGDKLTKIRKLVPLYRRGLIYHKYGMDELEHELKRFPKGKHDDIIDAEQMLYDLYTLQPNNAAYDEGFVVGRDETGRPIIS